MFGKQRVKSQYSSPCRQPAQSRRYNPRLTSGRANMLPAILPNHCQQLPILQVQNPASLALQTSSRKGESGQLLIQRNTFSCSGSSPTEHVSEQANSRGLKPAARYTISNSALIARGAHLCSCRPPAGTKSLYRPHVCRSPLPKSAGRDSRYFGCETGFSDRQTRVIPSAGRATKAR